MGAGYGSPPFANPMGNAQRGEITITAGEQQYTLVLDTNALALLDDAHEAGAWDVFEKAAKGRPGAIRKFVWAALQRHHAGTVKTFDDAGRVIDAAGGILAIGQQFEALQTAATPDKADLDELGVESRPQVAQAVPARKRRGTGAVSTFAPVRSA